MKDEIKKAIVKELLTLRTIEHDYTIEKLAELANVKKTPYQDMKMVLAVI